MLPFRMMIAALCCMFLLAIPETGIAQTDGVQPIPRTAPEIPSVEAMQAGDGFYRGIMRAGANAVRAGAISRRDFGRLTVGMISPAFRHHAEDLAIIQMSASGAEVVGSSDAIPVDDLGRIDRGKIDWEALGKFLEVLIPLLIQLLDHWQSGGIGMLFVSTVDEVPHLAILAFT